MTSVAPPPPPPPPAALGNAAQLTVTLGAQASLTLSKVALDSLITGLIRPQTAGGETVLQTNLGTFQFKAPFTLPPNAQATFKLVQTQPAAQIQLTHINGKPIPTNTPAARVANLATQFMQTGVKPTTQGGQAVGQTAQPQVGNTAGPATLLNLNTASGIRAFVLSPPTPQGTTQQNTAGQTTSQTAQTSTAGTPQAKGVTVQTAQVTTGQTAQAGTPGQTTSTTFQPGNQLNVRLLSVQQPGQSASNTAQTNSVTSANTVITQGTVQGQTATQQPIIRTPQGLIALDTTAKMMDGTNIRLEVLSSTKPQASPAAPKVATSPTETLSQKWPALEETLQSLKEINPALADQMSKAMLPKPDNRLALNMIFFLKALGRGNFKNWANESTLKALTASKPNLLKKLEGDFQNLSDKAKTPNSTDWKIAYVPMQNNDQISQIRIAQRDHRDEQQDGKEDPGVRFVIDLDLSRLGELQLDGLAKDSVKKFDLIVRAKSPLPGFMRKEIHDIFEKGMSAIGFDGKINFQVTSQFVDVEGIDLQKTNLNLGMLV
ncbi:hypothetical protein RYZ26_05330 [Terasakiella sp. A23]|uniref:hypothetical protein n=1 Tax=Terasakiella sp. FCG-A23 TaxID=3080561 RepID=UPI002955DA3D|nr:hypothetical protein [Terasakiella sp. A23]MDV7339002.1 hypothetical protein [Terasakiella sp. A23]